MWKAFLQPVKATFPLIAGFFSTFFLTCAVYSQQNIIANKDNTRPETARRYDGPPARISALTAAKLTGYNEVQWTATGEQTARKFILEYSWDGIDFQSAGEVVPAKGIYIMKHYTPDLRPLLYRVQVEELSGKTYYSDNILLNGTADLPVKIYPTVVTGNTVNMNADFPVERVVIVSSQGQQVLAKDLNGATEYMRINIPTLNKGLYFITFYGNGWKSTSKFIVG